MPVQQNIKITRSWRKSLSLHILGDGTLEVRAPYFVTKGDIDRFIDKNNEWIEKRIQTVSQRTKVVKRKYISGDEFLYLGNTVVLTIGNYKEIAVRDGKLLLPQFLAFRADKEINQWFITQGKRMIERYVNLYAEKMNVEYVSVGFADTKSKWGHCTSDNRLQFNWRLIMAPELTLIYVVVHELSHITNKNHSQKFWDTVRLYNPTYKHQRLWLKKHGDLLMT